MGHPAKTPLHNATEAASSRSLHIITASPHAEHEG